MEGQQDPAFDSEDEIYNPELESMSKNEENSASEDSQQEESTLNLPSSSSVKQENDDFVYESDDVSEAELLPPVSIENIIPGSRLRPRN